MRLRYLTGLLTALLALSSAGAQQGDPLRRNVQFERLTTDDGLSHEMVYDIVQDRRGFVWLATQEGLARFDGYEVRTFFHLRTDEETLSNDFVRTLFRDAEDRLWIGTEAGVNRYLAAEDAFLRDPFPDLEDGPLEHSIRAMAQTRDGALWFGTAGGGLVHVAADGASLKVFGPGSDPALPTDTVLALHLAADGTLWVGTENAGVYRFDARDARFVRPDALAPLSETSVRALHEDEAGHIWIGTDAAGAARYDPARDVLIRPGPDSDTAGALASPRVRDIHEDPDGTLWFATDAGLAEWRAQADAFVHYRHDDTNARSIASDGVNAIFTDASGVLWVGTWAGASRWNYLSDVFTYLLAEDGRLPGDWINSVAEDSDGVLWVATYGDGLGRFDPATGEARFYRHDPADERSPPEDRVMSVHVDGADRVWIGTRSAGLARLEAESGRFVQYRNDAEDDGSISADAITCILEGPGGDLWVGTFGGGLNRLAGGEGEHFERFTSAANDSGAIASDAVLVLAAAGDDALWVGTLGGGLDRLDRTSGRFEHFRDFEVAASGGERLQLDSVTDLLLASDGTLWIGTLGQGLLRWSPEAEAAGDARVRIYDKAVGMPADAIYGIVEDGEGMIWSSSNRGLVRLEPDTGRLRLFDDRNGLRDSEFNGARLRARTGHLLFGGPEGLVRFRPDELPFNDRPPRIMLTAASRSERLAISSSTDAAPAVRLGYLDPFLAFEFVALDFVSPDKNQYRYRLAGFDPDWVQAGAFRRATYTNLPAGRYVFEVQASNNDGVWNEQSAAIEVLAVPAPWNSLWAYALYALTALTAAGLYLRAQREKLARESRQRVLLEELVEKRTRELAQSNRDLHQLNERLEEAAVTDSLTGLRNRRYADQFLAGEISKFEREQQKRFEEIRDRGEAASSRSMFLMMLDLDGFKAINDCFGHHVGDEALHQVRDLLLTTCRASDTIIRWGGDEFLIAGTTTDYADVKILAERLRDAIASHAFDVGNGRTARLSASIGVSPYPLVPGRFSFCNWELVSAVADQAAYIAKSSARDAWVSLVGSDDLTPGELTDLGDGIGALIERGRLRLETELGGPLTLANGRRIVPPDAGAASG